MKTEVEKQVKRFVITYRKNTNNEPYIAIDGGDTNDIENARIFNEKEADDYVKEHDEYPCKLEVNVDENDNIIHD